jgi:methionyl aminopeptidase
MMSITSERDLAALMRIGRIVGLTIHKMRDALRPGITTAELDAIGAEFLKANGARSAPQLAYNFPGATCISINDEVAHGIPGSRVIQPGDVVNIDVSAELNGYWADSGATYPVPPVSAETQRICDCARAALVRAIEVARTGQHIHAIGKAVETHADRCGFNVIRELSGHGVGRGIHEKPSIPNYYTKRAKERLSDGLVVTLEPFVTNGNGRIHTADDGWTIKTDQVCITAQYEHTVVITSGTPILVTAVEGGF